MKPEVFEQTFATMLESALIQSNDVCRLDYLNSCAKHGEEQKEIVRRVKILFFGLDFSFAGII